MSEYIEQRVIEEAAYLIQTKDTIRKTAKKFGVSKSTVHKDMTERLKYVKPEMEEYIRRIINFNRAERHIRGGEATKRKYADA